MPDTKPTFETIYSTYYQSVCRWAKAAGTPVAEVEDVAQEVFIVVQRSLEAFEDRGLKSWLYTITRRAAKDRRNSSWYQRWHRPAEDIDLDVIAGGAEDREIERMVARDAVDGLTRNMSCKKKTILIGFLMEERSGEELAAQLGVPIDTIWSRLRHARNETTATAIVWRARGML